MGEDGGFTLEMEIFRLADASGYHDSSIRKVSMVRVSGGMRRAAGVADGIGLRAGRKGRAAAGVKWMSAGVKWAGTVVKVGAAWVKWVCAGVKVAVAAVKGVRAGVEWGVVQVIGGPAAF